MIAFATTLLLAAGSYAMPLLPRQSPVPHRGCASIKSDADVLRAEADFQAARDSIKADFTTLGLTPIPVVWHVIHGAETLEEGFIPDEQVTGSIDAMNEHYAGTGFSFVLQDTTRTANAEWFKSVGPDSAQQTEMKESLRVGDEKTLNIYTVGFQSGDAAGLLGYATFPVDYESAPKDDGVVLLYSSVPGGSSENFNEGKTLTHEVGHWIGLYHVFQGGCSGEGDGVDDTPAQQEATSGCPAKQDSCPNSPGVDSVHNFMDYSYDSCMNEFTPGQITRAREMCITYRHLADDGTEPTETSEPTETETDTSVPEPTETEEPEPTETEEPEPTETEEPEPTETEEPTEPEDPEPTDSESDADIAPKNNCPWWWSDCPWAYW